MVEKITKENWTDFDALIATPDVMKSVGRLGKILGPKGLMPNPKTGTVTFDVAKAVQEVKAGKVEFRTDKTALVHVPVGKISFTPDKLIENATVVITSVIKAKPSVAKGKYIKGCTLSSTMGPGILLDVSPIETGGEGVVREARLKRAARKDPSATKPGTVAIRMTKRFRRIESCQLLKRKRQQQVEKLSKDLKNVSNVVVATYTKMTVPQDYELRKVLRGAGAKYQVVKNTLAEKAAKGTKVEAALTDLTGVTSIAYTTGDPVAMAKALTKYAKDTPEFTFKVGVVEGRVVTIKEIEALATMPSKEELYSKLLFLINAPAQRLVTVMNAVGRNLAVVVDQGVQQKKFKEA